MINKIRELSTSLHQPQLTAHADYVIKRIFCQALKQTFSHFCEKVFSVVSEREIAR